MLHSRKGFTLLELSIVVAFVALISTVALPMVNSISPFVLDKAVGQVEYALKFARAHAMAINTPVIVRFDTAARSIRVARIVEETFVFIEVPLMHPLTKSAYSVALDSQPLTAANIGLRAEFTFSDGSKAPHVTFDKSGAAGRIYIANTFTPIMEPGVWRGLWRTSEAYSVGDWIEYEKLMYDCLSGHTAGSSFAADLSAGKWKARTFPGQVTVSAGPHQRNVFVEPTWGFIQAQPK